MAEEVEDPSQAVVSKAARLAITAAAVVAEQVARQRQRAAQDLAAAEGAEAERLQSRWNAEGSAARTYVGSADDAWLERASVDEAAEAWRTASVWSQFEPEAFAADEARLAAAIEARYGVDVRRVDVDGKGEAADLRGLANPERVREREAEQASEAERARERALERDDEIGAGLVMGGAAQDAAANRAATEQGEMVGHARRAAGLDLAADDVEYDTDARRAALAQRAAAGGADEKTVEGRVVASNANSRPGRQATTRRARPATLGRPPTTPNKSVEIER